MNAVAGGWRINGIVDASSGFPFSVYSGFHTATFYDSGTRVATTSANGVTNRADYAGSGDIGEVRRTERGVDFFSAEERAMFQTPEAGDTGSKRNLFTGPGYFQIDLGIFKNFTIGGQRLELRTEIFNLSIRSNSGSPSLLPPGLFRALPETRVPPRIVQLRGGVEIFRGFVLYSPR